MNNTAVNVQVKGVLLIFFLITCNTKLKNMYNSVIFYHHPEQDMYNISIGLDLSLDTLPNQYLSSFRLPLFWLLLTVD